MSAGLGRRCSKCFAAHPHNLASNEMHEIDEVLLEGAFYRPRSRQIDAMIGNDAARPGAHHENAIGQKSGFAQVMGYEHAGEFSLQP
jgi:hypothetical protein